MAVELAADVPGVALIDRLSQRPQPIVHKVQLPPKPDISKAPPRLSDGVPMDIDAIAAELGFTYDAYCHECVLQHICHCCGGRYNSVHSETRRCPLDKNDQLSKPQILAIWRDWGGSAGDGIGGRADGRTQGSHAISSVDRWSSSSGCYPPSHPTFPSHLPTDKGKKRQLVSEESSDHLSKRALNNQQSNSPSASTSRGIVDTVEMEPMTLGELFFERQLAEAQYDESNQMFGVG
ncbi:hypothetical protein PGTUg99_010765 [Puccinia graminis f. sp. tritici]|uniref:Uncharacterized protein n=1 Tax=Puccinia graminis f. sp. tritici TaxID=56615 RepID=A0A5B0R945_PUCGR|nr:hypothetical protein PGTUg99_010765 [Puccinia graminis f. sp. tritici]